MSKEKWAKAHVKARIKENEKSYHLEMPDRVVYPAGPIKMQIGKPVDHMGATLLLGELLYEFRREVARLSPITST